MTAKEKECGKCKLLGDAAPCDERYAMRGMAIPYPELLKPSNSMCDLALSLGLALDAEKHYKMGVDTYDKNFGAICVLSKKGKGDEITVEYSSRLPIEDFEEEVKRVAEFYKISTENILKEQDL